MEENKCYFVSYVYRDNAGYGFGNCHTKINENTNTLKKLESEILKSGSNNHICIQNFIEISEKSFNKNLKGKKNEESKTIKKQNTIKARVHSNKQERAAYNNSKIKRWCTDKIKQKQRKRLFFG